MSLGNSCIERVCCCLTALSMLTVRVVVLEHSQLHKKAYNSIFRVREGLGPRLGYARLVSGNCKGRGDGGRGNATHPDRTNKNLLATGLISSLRQAFVWLCNGLDSLLLLVLGLGLMPAAVWTINLTSSAPRYKKTKLEAVRRSRMLRGLRRRIMVPEV